MLLNPDEQEGDICRGDAGYAGGLADGAGAHAGQALAGLGLHGGDGGVVDIGGDFLVFLALEAGSGGAHAVNVAGVGNLRGNGFPEFIRILGAEGLRELVPVVAGAAEPELQ